MNNESSTDAFAAAASRFSSAKFARRRSGAKNETRNERDTCERGCLLYVSISNSGTCRSEFLRIRSNFNARAQRAINHASDIVARDTFFPLLSLFLLSFRENR